MIVTAVAVLDAARKLLGTFEEPNPPGNSNHVPGITDWYGIDPGPWCAMSLSKVFFNAGFVEAVDFSTPRGFSYTPVGVAGFQQRGQWHTHEYDMLPGDVVFYRDSSRVHHVELIESLPSPSEMVTLGGNVSNAYRRQTRLRSGVSGLWLAGFGRPAYRVPAPPVPPGPGPQPVPVPIPQEVAVSAIQLTTYRVSGGSTDKSVCWVGANSQQLGKETSIPAAVLTGEGTWKVVNIDGAPVKQGTTHPDRPTVVQVDHDGQLYVTATATEVLVEMREIHYLT